MRRYSDSGRGMTARAMSIRPNTRSQIVYARLKYVCSILHNSPLVCKTDQPGSAIRATLEKG